MTIQEFSRWLQATAASEWLQKAIWMIPGLQTVHILGICVVMSSITMLVLWLFGLVGRSWPLPEITRRFLPWLWMSLIVMLCSGVALVLADPERALMNEVFWLKMSVLLGAVLTTALFQFSCARRTELWERRRLAAAVMASVLFVMWVGTAAAGRWIAYFERS